MKILLITLILVLGLMFSACGSSGSNTEDRPLEGTEWILYEMNGVKLQPAEGKNVTVKFDSTENNINGKAPCNTYGGPFIKSPGKLYFGGIFSTEMACDDLKAEQEYFGLLSKVFNYRISGNKLYLLDNSQNVILRFKAQ